MVRQKKQNSTNATSLTPGRIIEAALRIADLEADLSSLTVRRLANDLGVGTMTLYSYFRSKDEILDAMADHVLGSMQMPAAEPGEGPAEALRTVAQSFVAMMREHPSVVRLLSTRVTDSQTALRGAMEAVLARLIDAGIPGPIAVQCYGFLITYAIGFVGYQTPRAWGHASTAEASEKRRQRSHFYAGLPLDEFPSVVEYSADVANLASDEQFTAGVDAYVDSIMRQLKQASVTT
jgi:AcrR family transcriptional regulator